MAWKRIIPCLDVDRGRVVKGVNFVGIRDAGDPVELAERYDGEGADEIVLLDITATSDRRDTAVDLAERVAAKVFVPFTIGGGIRSVEEAQQVLDAGADKIAVNSAAVERPDLIAELAARFGSQCVVLAVDASAWEGRPGWQVHVAGGRVATGLDLVDWVRRATELGAGEILLTSMDRDGTREGYDLLMLEAVCAAITVPVIASGGAGSIEDVADVLRGPVDAALIASIVHDGDTTLPDLKEELISAGIGIRPPSQRAGDPGGAVERRSDRGTKP